MPRFHPVFAGQIVFPPPLQRLVSGDAEKVRSCGRYAPDHTNMPDAVLLSTPARYPRHTPPIRSPNDCSSDSCRNAASEPFRAALTKAMRRLESINARTEQESQFSKFTSGDSSQFQIKRSAGCVPKPNHWGSWRYLRPGTRLIQTCWYRAGMRVIGHDETPCPLVARPTLSGTFVSARTNRKRLWAQLHRNHVTSSLERFCKAGEASNF